MSKENGNPLRWLKFQFQGSTIVIDPDEYPDAVKVIDAEGTLVDELKDISLHKDDLIWALNFLESINTINDKTIQYVLWCSSLALFYKCFGKNDARTRVRLNRDEVYANQEPEAITIFDYLKHMRNKHIIHDENPYSQSSVGVIINNVNAEPKVGDAVSIVMRTESLDQSNYNNLHTLISRALGWVNNRQQELSYQIVQQYSKVPYEELIKRKDAIGFVVPGPTDISRKRK